MNQLINSVRIRLHNLSIRSKVMGFSIALVLISAASIISILYLNISAGYRKQMQYSENQSFMQAQEFILYKVRSMIYASAVINYNNDIQSALTNSLQTADSSSFQEQYRDMLTMERILSTVELQQYVFRASIYVPSSLFYAGDNPYFINMNDIIHTEAYASIVNNRIPLLWLPPQEIPTPNESSPSARMISMLRPIRSAHDSNTLLGIQRVSILADDIDSILQKSDITQEGVVFLYNSKHELISCSNEDTYQSLSPYEDIIRTESGIGADWKDLRLGNRLFLLKSSSIPDTDWFLTAIIPYKEITRQSRQIGFIMFGLMGVIGAVAVICSYFFAESIAGRMRLLSEKMEQVQNGDLSVRVQTNNGDEIGSLYCSFNYMTKRLAILAEDQYNLGKAVKNAELKALQSQINPHFLYNTLDLINWEALDNNSPKISKLTQALAKFYRLSLSGGQDIVPLKDEIEHVNAYIQIQNYRFDNRIGLKIQIPDELLHLPVIKLVLQPLVENSIIHGRIGSDFIPSGQITISGEALQDTVVLQVIDNGIGIAPDRLGRLLDPELSHGSYGLYNIDQRFKLYYGENYGLSLQSAPHMGTVVFIRFPRPTAEETSDV